MKTKWVVFSKNHSFDVGLINNKPKKKKFAIIRKMNDCDVEIIKNLQEELLSLINNGCGPFLAAIYDEDYNLIAKAQNTVVKERCSNNHAEMNTIRMAQERLGTYNLSKYNLSIYVTSEPCVMCLGGIMWSGIKKVYYSVPSDKVEKITGFDEGFKPNWIEEFNKRGIEVYPCILEDVGIEVLKTYVKNGGIIYKP